MLDQGFWSKLEPYLIKLAIKSRSDSTKEKLGHWESNAVRHVVFIALLSPERLNIEKFRPILHSFSRAMVSAASQVFFEVSNDRTPNGDKQYDWNVGIGPFLRKHWPRERSKRSQSESYNLIEAALAQGHNFPSAASDIMSYLSIEKYQESTSRLYHDEIRQDLLETKDAAKQALEILMRVYNPQNIDHSGIINQFLDQIKHKYSDLALEDSYASLAKLLDRH